MKARFTVIKGKDKGKSFLVAEGKPVTLGRSSAADIALSEPRISRIHCRFTHDGKHIMLTDLNSTNGTFVNERKIKSVPLGEGDAIRIGETVITIALEQGAEPPAPPAPKAAEEKKRPLEAEDREVTVKRRAEPPAEAPAKPAKSAEPRAPERLSRPAPPEPRAPGRAAGRGADEGEGSVMGLFDKWLDDPQKRGQEKRAPAAPAPPAPQPKMEAERPVAPSEPSAIPGVELKNRLSEDAMGESFEAVQLFLARPVAVRVLSGGPARDKAVSRDFVELAKSKAKLNHPNIVQVYDAGKAGGAYYIVSEMPEGLTLEALIAREGQKRPLHANLALEIALQVARALRRAHAERLVHWDLRPGTVFISRERVAKVGGFTFPGIVIRTSREAGEMTSSLPVHAYMAPELIQNLEASDAKADVYGLGAVLYEMLSGRPPFEADTDRALMDMMLRERPETPQKFNASLPAEVCLFVLKCLAKDPANRYASAAELVKELKALPRVKATAEEE